jgi:predicted DNA-binding transcriptional regulator AlpA
MTKHFLGLEEVSKLTGISKQNIQMHKSSNTFPVPAVYVGTRSGWALEQMEDYSKTKGLKLNEELYEEFKTMSAENKEIKGVPPFYYLGITEVANLIGWQPPKVKMYENRGTFPSATVYIGKRGAWSLASVKKFAQANDIELKEVANENLVETVLEITDEEVWTVAPTYTGNWLSRKESIEKVIHNKTYKGKKTPVNRTVKNLYSSEVFKNRNEAINFLLFEAVNNNFEDGVLAPFDTNLALSGDLVEVTFRYKQFNVLPREKAEGLFEKEVNKETCKEYAEASFEEGKGKQHGVCAFHLKKGKLIHYTTTLDVIPPLDKPVIILYWIDKDTKEHYDLTEQAVEQFNWYY